MALKNHVLDAFGQKTLVFYVNQCQQLEQIYHKQIKTEII